MKRRGFIAGTIAATVGGASGVGVSHAGTPPINAPMRISVNPVKEPERPSGLFISQQIPEFRFAIGEHKSPLLFVNEEHAADCNTSADGEPGFLLTTGKPFRYSDTEKAWIEVIDGLR